MRLKTPTVKIRDVKIGGNHQIVIQSMTNTDTADAEATAKQCIELASSGSELVRITVNNEKAAKAVPKIRGSHWPAIAVFSVTVLRAVVNRTLRKITGNP